MDALANDPITQQPFLPENRYAIFEASVDFLELYYDWVDKNFEIDPTHEVPLFEPLPESAKVLRFATSTIYPSDYYLTDEGVQRLLKEMQYAEADGRYFGKLSRTQVAALVHLFSSLNSMNNNEDTINDKTWRVGQQLFKEVGYNPDRRAPTEGLKVFLDSFAALNLEQRQQIIKWVEEASGRTITSSFRSLMKDEDILNTETLSGDR